MSDDRNRRCQGIDGRRTSLRRPYSTMACLTWHGLGEIAAYYDDPVKQAYDAFCTTKAYGLKALSMDTRPELGRATLGKVRLARIKMHAAANPSAPHGQVSSKGGPTLLRQRVLAGFYSRRTPKLGTGARPAFLELLFRLLL